MKVLLAIDSSPSSKVVIDQMEARPWPKDTTVCVLNVVDTVSGASVWVDMEPFVKSETEAAQKLVQETAERLANRGVQTATEVLNGYPPDKIIEQAKQWEADFVFLGSHGHSAVSRFLMGSVAKAVLRGADCSVEIVRAQVGERSGAMKILLATDGSDCSIAAARSIAERPWPEGSEVRALKIVEVVVPAMDPWYAAGEILDRIREESLKQAEADVRAAEKIISDAGLKATGVVLTGYPKAVIVDEAKAWDADLVVSGSHGRHGITRLLMGSVSEAVAMHAHCSVEVIRS